jgi:signal transduction histidine kinase
MPFSQWFRPPRHVLTVFLCLMCVFGGAMGWFGWQLLRQERSLERQRVQERLEQAADHMAATLQRSLSELETYLGFVPGPGVKQPPEGVALLRATERTITVYPPARLLYYPATPGGQEPSAAAFIEGEKLEFQQNDPGKAAEAFRKLARSPNPAVRSGALLRLGRTLRKTGRNQEALGVYDQLAQLGAARVLELPSELVAREARCSTLEAMGKREELRKEAALMYSALLSGRWSLLRPAWEFHREEAGRWSEAGLLTERQRNALLLSGAAEWVYGQWRIAPESKGRRILKIEGQPVLASWTGTSDRLSSVLAAPGHLGLMWNGALAGQRVQAALVDADGQVLLGSLRKNVPQAVRAAAATGLPWTLQVASTDAGAEQAGFAGRRRLLLSGFAVLALVVLAGSYFILRSISREIAVAGLQSEFVATVSHEFRTPLTSLRQLSEMLSKGRVPTEELRQQSYDILAHESERLQRLVESLLDFGRMEARAVRYQFQDVDPSALVGDVVTEFREKAAALGYQVELARDGAYPPIRADREALALALWNLLDNAVKYSPDQRTIWVEMAGERDRLAIRVRDRGIGIPAPEQKEIFKKFVRGAGSRASSIKGTGIGLTMVRYIVEAHGGEIRLDSAPGQGSTFAILLPVI